MERYWCPGATVASDTAKDQVMPTKAKPAHAPRKGKPAVKVAPAPKRRAKPTPAAPVPTGTKQSQLIALLRKPHGSNLLGLMTVTGWQPHSVRGVISGVLRKRLGLNVVCTNEAGQRTYRIVDAA
jgi:hypothetical protein